MTSLHLRHSNIKNHTPDDITPPKDTIGFLSAFRSRSKQIQMPSVIIKEGIMAKWTNYMSAWKDRHFMVEPGFMKYSQFHGAPFKDTILLNKSCRLRYCRGDPCRFEIEHSTGVVYLRCSSLDEKNSWVNSISKGMRVFASNDLVKFETPSDRATPNRSDVTPTPIISTWKSCMEKSTTPRDAGFTNNDEQFISDSEEEYRSPMITLLERSIKTRHYLREFNSETRKLQSRLISIAGLTKDDQFRDEIKILSLSVVENLDQLSTLISETLDITEFYASEENAQRRRLEKSLRHVAKQNYEMERVHSEHLLPTSEIVVSLPTTRVDKQDKVISRSLDDAAEEFFDIDETMQDLEIRVSDREMIPRRTVLPKPRTDFKISLWSLLKSCIGKDLSQVAMPVYFNEPTTLLQRVAEDHQYCSLLQKASEQPFAIDRLVYVMLYCLSPFSSAVGRTYKPFNPLLGETYEISHRGFRYIAEQVGHHPPVTACYTESDYFIHWADFQIRNRFTGKSLELKFCGNCQIVLPETTNKDFYSYKKFDMFINNVIFGNLFFELSGIIPIVNHSTGEFALIEAVRKSWWESEFHKIRGIICDNRGIPIYRIGGHWSTDIWLEECYLPVNYKEPTTIANPLKPIFHQKLSIYTISDLRRRGMNHSENTHKPDINTHKPDINTHKPDISFGPSNPPPPTTLDGIPFDSPSCSESPQSFSETAVNCDTYDNYRTPNDSVSPNMTRLSDQRSLISRPLTDVCKEAALDTNGSHLLHSYPTLQVDWHLLTSKSESRRVLWVPTQKPSHSADYYQFGHLTFELNEVTRDYDPKCGSPMPVTDARFRPDQRAYEEGDVCLAQQEKLRLEDEQRSRARQRDGESNYNPRWFVRGVNPITGDDAWLYSGGYWEAKKEGKFKNCQTIFE